MAQRRGEQDRTHDGSLARLPGTLLGGADLALGSQVARFPGLGLFRHICTARSVQVHHTLRQLVKPRQSCGYFFPLTFHQGDASQTERVSGSDGCQGWRVRTRPGALPFLPLPQTLISLWRGPVVGWEVVEGSGREGGSLEVFILFRSEILS